ncbi:MAG: hypothetical protein PWP31_411 [Clostridia bacterium]|nr:hypothetical protein [Clostridia bacterium]
MKVKSFRVLILVAFLIITMLQFNVPVAEASWGLEKLLNLNRSQDTSQNPPQTKEEQPRNPAEPQVPEEEENTQNPDATVDSETPDSKQSTADLIRYLRNRRLRYYNPGNTTPTTEPQKNQEQATAQPQAPKEEKNTQDPDVTADKEVLKLFNMVNEERKSRGLHPLMLHTELTNLAEMKSSDMVENNYFDHTSPNLGNFYEMVYNARIPFRQVGENLAYASCVEKAHYLLMGSEGHKKNILNPNFTHIGIGVAHDRYGVKVTQLFIAQ